MRATYMDVFWLGAVRDVSTAKIGHHLSHSRQVIQVTHDVIKSLQDSTAVPY